MTAYPITRFATLLLALMAAGVFTPAMSALTTKTYFAPADSNPVLAEDYLRAHPVDAIEITTGETLPGQVASEGIFFALGPVSRTRNVCRFTKTQVVPHRSGDQVAWDSKSSSPNEYVQVPFDMAVVTATPCPRRDDPSYIVLEKNISDADLVQIVAFWKEIASSEEKFNDASYFLPNIIPPRLADRFSAFKTALLGAPQMFRVLGIYRRGRDGFDLSIATESSDYVAYSLSVSKSGGGFMMVNFTADQ